MAHVLLKHPIWQAIEKRLQLLPFEGTGSDSTASQILNTFWNPFTNDIPDQRFMHDASSHSTFKESFDFIMRRKRFLEVAHSNCLCHRVVKGHLSPSLK